MRHLLLVLAGLGLAVTVMFGRREDEPEPSQPEPDLPVVTVDMTQAVLVYEANTFDTDK